MRCFATRIGFLLEAIIVAIGSDGVRRHLRCRREFVLHHSMTSNRLYAETRQRRGSGSPITK